MYVDHLSLMGFRTYGFLDLGLAPGLTVLVGPNGVGKTNIVEAIDYCANLSSHRVSNDAPLVKVGNDRAYIRTRVVRAHQQTTMELEVTPGKANRVRINRAAPVRVREALGICQTVLFSPEDLALVKGEPAARRRFLDDLAVSLRPVVAGYRADYERVLRQRNALLKSMRRTRRAGEDERATLEVWNGQLVNLGARLLQARFQVLAELLPEADRAYGQLTDGGKELGFVYESSTLGRREASDMSALAALTLPELSDMLTSAIEERAEDELDRGMSLVGPHRDELALMLGGIPARGYASQGETWSYALALRLGSWYVHRADAGDVPGASPILILDDVFAELDAVRRARLARIVTDAEQVLVTCAVEEDLPDELDVVRRVVRVRPGEAVAVEERTGARDG
ncbi:DNA replication/repair protein RecF [Rothia sp. AR01]|uniref:DNA replication and repair protein RecF n=1 Tax=Rothia santali TaxID=2949643 RepID=A0A9X2KHT6_9MICC|nr:DNA replication/repair protein RecF [Rothia santali]MCP3425513.1 DNA replication/repair protein RecF [Rothia santali]